MTAHGFPATHADALRRANALNADPDAAGPDLANFLYARWYANRCTDVVVDPDWPPLPGMLRVAQGEALGWHGAVVVRRGAGGVVVARDPAGRARALLRGGYAHVEGSDRAGLPPEVGEHVVAVPRSGSVVSEGWWRTWGGGWDPRLAPGGTVRVYLTPRVQQLPVLVGSLTAALGDRSEPWLIKVATRAEDLARTDALVVYLRGQAALDLVVRCAEGHVPSNPGPPLTAALAPGVSWAEDPGDGRSFGESRCALVADAFRRAAGRDDDSFLRAVRAVFELAGVDPAAPHLNGRRRAR